jgi:aminoglycoside phosphotransferase (APT) family kinase protein
MSSIDPRAALATLGAADATAVAPVSGGQDTAVWRVERVGEAYALRVFRAEQAAASRREVAALRAAADGGLPVPRVEAAATWQERPALLLSWCPGRTLLAELQRRPWCVRQLGLAVGRLHARIHAVAVPDILRQGPDSWIGWAGPVDDALRVRLLAAVDTIRPDALLHLDYHPLNIMVAGAAVTCVLDWTNVRAGDRRADLARTVTILRLAPIGAGPRAGLLALARRALERAWRGGYREAAGQLSGMAPFYAWAGGVMARDLAPRVGRLGTGLAPRHLDAIRQWTAGWERRAAVVR